MTGTSAHGAGWDVELTELHPAVRAWLADALESGAPVRLHSDGRMTATLTITPAVHEGRVIRAGGSSGETSDESVTHEPLEPPQAARVVATTMKLGAAARERLRETFGPGWVVLDFHDAPPTADVVLTLPVSPRLTGVFAGMFPNAQIIVTEILDDEFGLDVGGPVGRMLDAGAHAYLPPRPLVQVAENVQAYLAGRGLLELSAGPAGTRPPAAGVLSARPD